MGFGENGAIEFNNGNLLANTSFTGSPHIGVFGRVNATQNKAQVYMDGVRKNIFVSTDNGNVTIEANDSNMSLARELMELVIRAIFKVKFMR